MSIGTGAQAWAARWGTEILGWILVPVGLVMMPAPGPGTLIVVAGIALLARRHAWARWLQDQVEERAIEAAKFGVATWPRIVLSALGCAWLFVLGAIWWRSPTIPEFDVLGVGFGPGLPAAGWGTAVGIWVSAVVAVGLLVFSVVRWHEPRAEGTQLAGKRSTSTPSGENVT